MRSAILKAAMRIGWIVKLAVLLPVLAFAAAGAQAQTANKRSPFRALDCESLEKRADAKYRYLLCSVGLYDRELKAYLETFDGVTARLPISQYAGKGFRSETGPVPKAYADVIRLSAPDATVLVWSDKDEPILIVRRNAEAKRTVVSTFIVSPKVIDANGLSVGAKPSDSWSKTLPKSCRMGRSLILKRGRDGIMTCPIRYIRTNLRRQNLYHAAGASQTISLFEITHSESK